MYLKKFVHIKKPKRRVSSEHIEEMKALLLREGQLKPIIIDQRNNIIDGVARYWAAHRLGWTMIYADFNGNGDNQLPTPRGRRSGSSFLQGERC